MAYFENEPCVHFSGPVLSTLLYENVKTCHEQEGFLVGTVAEVVKKSTSDHSSDIEHRQKIITITGVIPCTQTGLFYNNAGKINKEELSKILRKHEKSVVSWYRYEANSKFKLLLRQKIVHKELSEHFSIQPELFCCCLLSSTLSINKSTHVYTHSLLRYCNRFLNTSLHIINLGENNNCYKIPVKKSKGMAKIYDSMGLTKANFTIKSIDKVSDTLEENIQSEFLELCTSEKKLRGIENQFKGLKLRLDVMKDILAEKKLSLLQNGVINDWDIQETFINLNTTDDKLKKISQIQHQTLQNSSENSPEIKQQGRKNQRRGNEKKNMKKTPKENSCELNVCESNHLNVSKNSDTGFIDLTLSDDEQNMTNLPEVTITPIKKSMNYALAASSSKTNVNRHSYT